MDKLKMFSQDEPRYVTRGIEEKMPKLHQMILWHIIDNLRDSEVEADYLQVFDIITENYDSGKVLRIFHSQEIPNYKKEYSIPINDSDLSISGKVFVIDDTDHATMLWAEEY